MYSYHTIDQTICTRRRLRLPQRHNAPPATEPQSNSTHSSFRVLNFRDWFGVQIIECTFNHIQSTFGVSNFGIGSGFHASSAPLKAYYNPRLGYFRVLNFRDWFGGSCLKCTLKGILNSGANEGAWPYHYMICCDIVSYWSVLYCIVLYCIVLYWIVLYCIHIRY